MDHQVILCNTYSSMIGGTSLKHNIIESYKIERNILLFYFYSSNRPPVIYQKSCTRYSIIPNSKTI